jgi:predicted DCC family thiol-disulfide oxidoreductase YuxK
MAWVLFFDGECGFCSRSVRNIARWSRDAPLEFASLQGALAASHGFGHFAKEGGGSMVLLRESDGISFTESDALIELCGVLGGFWRFLKIAALIPKPLRDAAYRWFARNRYRLMGRADACALPDPDLAKRLRD